MTELSYNLLWSWDHLIRTLFRRLDRDEWKRCNYNPVLMLSRLPQEKLDAAANDPRYVALYRRACERLDTYMHRSANESAKPDPSRPSIAYFSMEYGLLDCMQIYSGGLGILSGDHLKASSDSDLPLVGVGMLYQKGYLQQVLNPDGWQMERLPINDFYTLPVRPVLDAADKEVRVQVELPSGIVHLKLWHMQVGRVTLYLLDTNIPENPLPDHRDITDQLYGGDIHTRIRQEIVLGIGGLRALRQVGLNPTVFHMNEGHSAFLAIERIRILMQEQGLTFEESLNASRNNNVFTTHTPVPAGIDVFDAGLMYEYFRGYCYHYQLPFEKVLALGRHNPQDQGETFSMAVLALKTSAFRNAVSKLHMLVSQEMFQDLWPKLPVNEVPITSVTNGVHLPTFVAGDLATLYDQYLQPDWRERYADPKVWDGVQEIPSQELWEAHRRKKRQLISFVRERMVNSAIKRKASVAEQRRLADVLDPEAFTIGFARRFATYKRATLFMKDTARLKRLLTNPEMPVQIIIAGKAHPKDHPGKTLIREIVQLSRDPALAKRLVFLEDYSIEVARELVQGADIWLNNPRRGEEACGTSGMKAGINGVLNLSILDGWYDEAYEVSGGWAIGDREPYSEDQDEMHASSIYSMLENEIVPLYYEHREEGMPEEWMERVKKSLRNLSPTYNCQRMVGEYMQKLYEPAHKAYQSMSGGEFASVREMSRWQEQLHTTWDRLSFVDVGPGPEASVQSGRPIAMRAVLDLAGLAPADVRVEAVVGRVGVSGQLEDTQVVELRPEGEQGQAIVFQREYVPQQTGRLGYAVRVSPNHSDNPLMRPCSALLKWGFE